MQQPAHKKMYKKPVVVSPATGNLELANIWKKYFNFIFFLGLSPFRIIQDEKSYKVKKKSLRSLLSGLVCLIVIIFSYNYIIREILRGRLHNEGTHDKSEFFFHVAIGIIRLSLTTLTIHELWFREQDIVRIINFLVDRSTYIPRVSSKKIQQVKTQLVATFLVLCCGDFLLEQYLIYEKAKQHGYWYSLCLYAEQYKFLNRETCLEPGSANVVSLPGKFISCFALLSKCLW